MSFLVHNDFHQTHGLFPLFDGLEVKDIDVPFTAATNGIESNGVDVKAAPAPGIENVPLTNGTATH